jgi:hypothetical protein
MAITLPELAEYEKPYVEKSRDFSEYFIEITKFFSEKLPNLVKEDTKVTDELKSAVRFLGWPIKPHEVSNLSWWVLLIAMVIDLTIIGLFAAFGYFSFISTIFGLTVPFVLAYSITNYPKSEARFERIEALGHAPNIITQLVIYLKQNPNLEKALYFVSQYSEGRIVNDLKKKLWQSLMGHKVNLKLELGKLAQQWGESLTELKRSIYLIVASISEKNEIKRNQTLDRAVRTSLEGVITKIREYTNKLYLPTLFLFSFGTILPLVIISLLPIFSFFGQELSSPIQMFLLLILSLAAIYIYSNMIIAQRPPSFSSIKLPDFLKDYPKAGNLKFSVFKKDFEVNTFYYTLIVFLVISAPGILYLISTLPQLNIYPGLFKEILQGFNTLTIIWGFGAAVALYCYGGSWYKKKLRDNIEQLESEMVDGIYQLASRINEGRSPESAIRSVGESMPDTRFGKLMLSTYSTMRTRHTTIEEALFNENFGTLREVYSKNFKLVMRIFINSLKRGVLNCAQTLFTMSDHFDKLEKTEKNLKETLQNSMSMMRTTASIFAPMITGLVITLQQLIQDGLASAQAQFGQLGYEYVNISFLKAPTLSVEMLQLITGIYMLILAALLIRYVVLLEYGKDEIMMKMELARNIPIALFIFTFTLVLSRFMIG